MHVFKHEYILCIYIFMYIISGDVLYYMYLGKIHTTWCSHVGVNTRYQTDTFNSIYILRVQSITCVVTCMERFLPYSSVHHVCYSSTGIKNSITRLLYTIVFTCLQAESGAYNVGKARPLSCNTARTRQGYTSLGIGVHVTHALRAKQLT